jgi:hypothetical protein
LKSLRWHCFCRIGGRKVVFTCTYTLFLACTCQIWLLCWLSSQLCEFHTEQWREPCSIPVSCLPNAFLQLIVCKSAVDCLKSLRAVLLSQDRRREGTCTCTLLPSDIATVFVPYLTTWTGRIIILCWRVQ